MRRLLPLLLLAALPHRATGQTNPAVMPKGPLSDQNATRAAEFHYVPTERALAWLGGDTLLVTHLDMYGGASIVYTNCDGSGFFKVPVGGGSPVRVGPSYCGLDRNIFVTPDGSSALFFGDPTFVRLGPSSVRADSPLLRMSLATQAIDTLRTGCGLGYKEIAVSSAGQLTWTGRCWSTEELTRDASCVNGDARARTPCSPEDRKAIYTSPLRGGESIRQGNPVEADVHEPSWSPDGRSIAFSAGANNNPGRWELTAVEPGTLMIVGPSGVRSLESKGESASWSPDGAWIAFFGEDDEDLSPRGGGPSVYVIRPDGTGRRRVFMNDLRMNYPDWFWGGMTMVESQGKIFGPLVWSPDAKWLAFARQAEDGASIWRVEVETGRVERLTVPE